MKAEYPVQATRSAATREHTDERQIEIDRHRDSHRDPLSRPGDRAPRPGRAEPLDLLEGEHIPNLSAREFGSFPAGLATHPVEFPAGDYVVSIITPVVTSDTHHDDAVFIAWSHAFGNAGTWHTAWRAWRDDEDEEIFISGGQWTQADSDADALAATIPERLVTPFTLDEPATLRFGFGDNTLHDNRGGVSLEIVIPEPASGVLALLGMGAVMMRRRRAGG